jgi:diguanylate cyclase (GGDEF)-like protein/PAS domain S-box-containing protein
MDSVTGPLLPGISTNYSVETQLKLTAAVYQNISDGVMITDHHCNIITVNNAFTEITGYTQKDVFGKNPRLLKSGIHPPEFYQSMWDSIQIIGSWQGEIQNRRKDGSIYPQNLNIITVKDDANHVHITHYIGIFSDQTLRKDTEEFFQFIATHDPLTNLPNRSMFYDHFNSAVYEARLNHWQIAIFFIDLDGFKNVNDTHGHEKGDQLLQVVAERLLDSIPAGATVSRIGGDEFALTLTAITTPSDAGDVAQKIIHSLAQPFILEETRVQITASVGISLYPGDGDNIENLLQNADRAMYRVKDNGKNNFTFFSSR